MRSEQSPAKSEHSATKKKGFTLSLPWLPCVTLPNALHHPCPPPQDRFAFFFSFFFTKKNLAVDCRYCKCEFDQRHCPKDNPPGNKHIPQKWPFEDYFPFPKVEYVSSLEGTNLQLDLLYCTVFFAAVSPF